MRTRKSFRRPSGHWIVIACPIAALDAPVAIANLPPRFVAHEMQSTVGRCGSGHSWFQHILRNAIPFQGAAMNTKKNRSTEDARAAARNEDPISGQSGAHPVGTGLGAAAAGAAAGALGGAVAGPVGAAIGAVAGGIAGGYAGKAVAEDVNPTYDPGYWSDYYPDSSYYDENIPFDHYEPAYRMGWDSYDEDEDGMTWQDREAQLRQEWESNQQSSGRLDWSRASAAAREAHDRASTYARERRQQAGNLDTTSTCEPRQPR
jgi:hypothetical protein